MEKTDEVKTQECHPCKRKKTSSTSKATFWCRECNEAFCDDCVGTHNTMKLLVNHKVLKIDEVLDSKHGIDLTAISEICPIHSMKVVEAYCFEHKTLCCVSCLTLQHRQCVDVQAIEDIPSIQKAELDKFEVVVTEIESATEKILYDKLKKKQLLDDSFKHIETLAVKTTSNLKKKIDALLSSFLAELHIKQEMKTSEFKSNLDLLNMLLVRIKHVSKVTKVIRENGSPTQLFIHLENLKPELLSVTRDIIPRVNEIPDTQADFMAGSLIKQVEESVLLGEIILTEKSKLPNDIPNNIEKLFLSMGHHLPLSLELKKKAVFTSGQNLRSGVCISNEQVIVCDSKRHNLKVIAISSGKVESIIQCKSPKRLSYDSDTSTLFISGFNGNITRIKLEKYFSKTFFTIYAVKDSPSNNGGLCIYKGNVYTIVDKEVQKMSFDHSSEFTTCFSTKTNCNHLNSLAVDPVESRFFYSSIDYRVICTAFDGTEIFSYKNENMRKVSSLTVHPIGIILGDETGSIHIISNDGKEGKVLLGKCEKIKNVNDVWLDTTERILFVCGNEYIEIYEITY